MSDDTIEEARAHAQHLVDTLTLGESLVIGQWSINRHDEVYGIYGPEGEQALAADSWEAVRHLPDLAFAADDAFPARIER